MSRHARPIVTCVCCGRQGEHRARGLRKSCYQVHRENNRLDQFPLGVGTTDRWKPEDLAEAINALKAHGVPGTKMFGILGFRSYGGFRNSYDKLKRRGLIDESRGAGADPQPEQDA